MDSYLSKLNQRQEDNGGIKLSKLKPGTKVVVETLYSKYEITVIGDGKVKVKGGRFFPEEVERSFLGSSWGGSMLKLDWIGHDMRMEFTNPPKGVITSRVIAATVCGDGWSFEMDWDQS